MERNSAAVTAAMLPSTRGAFFFAFYYEFPVRERIPLI
jgi:hypothetical protein